MTTPTEDEVAQLMRSVRNSIAEAEQLIADCKELLQAPQPKIAEFRMKYPNLKVKTTLSFSVSHQNAPYLRVIK